MILTLSGFCQLQFNGVGIGFDYNGGSRLTNSNFLAKVTDQSSPSHILESDIWVNRVFVDYIFNFKAKNNDYFSLETSVLQGAEYLNLYDYYSYQSGDTSFYEGVSVYTNASLLGLRLMSKFTTPTDRRFHFNVGIGAEGFAAYNINTSGNVNNGAYVDTSYNNYSYRNLNSNFIKSYQSYNLIQQVGMAFRLGKDETKFPMNHTYIETNFHLLNNFTMLENELSMYRTYGFSLALVYEIR